MYKETVKNLIELIGVLDDAIMDNIPLAQFTEKLTPEDRKAFFTIYRACDKVIGSIDEMENI